jgi:dihydrofolate reductase
MAGKIVITEDISLDGMIDDPQRIWAGHPRGAAGDQFKLDELAAADAILLGRTTYEGFAAHWPKSKEPYAAPINSLPKHVVGTRLKQTDWKDSQLISEAIPERLAKLKQQYARNILVYGSASLCHLLLQHDLVDQIHLMCYPTVQGGGKKLFPDGVKANLRLAECRQLGTDVVLLRYTRANGAAA